MGTLFTGMLGFLLFIKSNERYNRGTIVQQMNKGVTIGQTIKKDGFYLTNIGDLNDNDNWVPIAKCEPIYFVNIYEQEKNEFIVKIEDSSDEDALDQFMCEGERDVETTVDSVTAFYSHIGTVHIDERFNYIKKVILTDPFYIKQRRHV